MSIRVAAAVVLSWALIGGCTSPASLKPGVALWSSCWGVLTGQMIAAGACAAALHPLRKTCDRLVTHWLG